MEHVFLALSVIFALLSPVIGITAVLMGNFRPQRMTRLLIFVISLLFVGSLWEQGDRNGIYVAGAQLLGGMVLLLLSIKRGMGGTNRLDLLVLALALASLLAWKATNNPLLGLLMSIVTDLIAFSPTLVKTWKYPETEEWKFYASDVVASTFSLLSITTYGLATIAFPAYIWLINMVSVVMILGRRNMRRPE